jgi:hypothetical protein
MATKDKIFSSKTKYQGFFDFPEFYRFCYEWLNEEENFKITEKKYVEKLQGTLKNIEIEWQAEKEVNDYFKFEIGIKFKIMRLEKTEIIQNNKKIQTNKGSVEIKLAGKLVKDYKGKFEINSWTKFTRGIYERWIISTGITAMEDKLSSICDGVLSQAKAYFDLEGKK